jgi:hypothetical protein
MLKTRMPKRLISCVDKAGALCATFWAAAAIAPAKKGVKHPTELMIPVGSPLLAKPGWRDNQKTASCCELSQVR